MASNRVERYWLSKEKTRDENWDERTRAFVEVSVPADVNDECKERLTAELRPHDALFVTNEEVTRRKRRGQRRLLEQLDDTIIEAYLNDREVDR